MDSTNNKDHIYFIKTTIPDPFTNSVLDENVPKLISNQIERRQVKDDSLRIPSIMLVENHGKDKHDLDRSLNSSDNSKDSEKIIDSSEGSSTEDKSMDKDEIEASKTLYQIISSIDDNISISTYEGDVQGPINKEPDEKLSSINNVKEPGAIKEVGSISSKDSSNLNESSRLDIPSDTPTTVITEDNFEIKRKSFRVQNNDTEEKNQDKITNLEITMPKSVPINKGCEFSVNKEEEEENASFDSNQSEMYLSTSNIRRNSFNPPRKDELMDVSNEQLIHNQTAPQFDVKFDNNDEMIPSNFSTPRKNSKSFRQHNSSSNMNMNSYAFMSTYNNLPSNVKNSPTMTPSDSKKEKNKKPWYSAFINTYKQKNDEFRKLFKLTQDEHLLVDYSCALQREILAHGRLYVSLNYVCFRANIIGWETTISIKLKDIRNIFKDKTAKIIPNAITIVLDNERYFLTSFASRDKTYTTLFRVWQIALADASMSLDEINNILKSSYGEDLGYDSDDVEYEYYSKLKSKSSTQNEDISSDMKNSHPKQILTQKNKDEKANSNPSSVEGSFLKENDLSLSSATEKLVRSSLGLLGHRHSSSYDASYITADESKERPISMLVSKQSSQGALNQPKLNQRSPTSQSASGFEGSKLNNSLDNQEKFTGLSIDDNNNAQKSNNSDGEHLMKENEIPVVNVQSTSDSEKKSNFEQYNKSNNSNISTPSAPNEVSNSRESSSDSIGSETHESENNVKCSCHGKHQGKQMVNQVYDLSVNYLWECLFGQTDFRVKYWDSRNFIGLKVSEWKKSPPGAVAGRLLEYAVDLGTLGKPSNSENQRILEYKPDKCIVLESESETHNVAYSDHFTVRNKFCFTRVSANSTRFVVHSYINYIIKPNFIVKTFIEKNTFSALKDSYSYLEKHIPNIKPQLKYPSQISALTNSQVNIDRSNTSIRASTPASSNNASVSNINSSENDVINESPVKEETYQQQKSIKFASNKNNKRRVKDSNNLNFNDIPNNTEYNQINPMGQSQFQPQLVPIQTFSFFKWKINVDTLVRLFIIAMICLMVINAMLYYKLRRIEALADGLKSDPNVIERISAMKNSKQLHNEMNEHTLHNDLLGWRDVISNTLNVIEKMEESLKEWDKSLEKRQILDKNKFNEPKFSNQMNQQSFTNNDLNNKKIIEDL